jgi:glycosyltransferase involved in cell wall biosynthesis
VTPDARVLILTPLKDCARDLDRYSALFESLSYPRQLLSIGLLESDSRDGTWEAVQALLPRLSQSCRKAQAWKKDFGFHLPDETSRWVRFLQIPRRAALAKSRNHLLFHALDDEDWVLWLDADLSFYPNDLVEQLLAVQREIVHPHCVQVTGGPSFDHNAWRDNGKLLMQDLRAEGELVRLDSVGGTALLVRADLHRDGLVFPPFPYGRKNSRARTNHPFTGPEGGEMETEGLALMAAEMGHQCWGMPLLEIRHVTR